MKDTGLTIAMSMFMIYFLVSQLIAVYFWYELAQEHGFLYTIFIGPFEAELKGLLWPFFIQNMKLDEKELKKAFNSIPKSRQRANVDQRAYIIGALYYACGMTEQLVAEHLNIGRDNVHHAKVCSIRFKGDIVYQYNTEKLRKKFEYTAEDVKLATKSKNDAVLIQFNDYDLKKLRKLQQKLGYPTLIRTIKYFVRNGMRTYTIWEE